MFFVFIDSKLTRFKTSIYVARVLG